MKTPIRDPRQLAPRQLAPRQLDSGLRPQAAWFNHDAAESGGVTRYLEALVAGRRIILATFVACLAVAAAYLGTASKTFEAETDILITPQPALAVAVPGIITQSSDPSRDVETVSRLVSSPSVTRRVRSDLGLSGSLQSIAGRIQVTPLAQSNIVTIVASAPTAREAAELADAFGEQFVASRTERLRESVQPQIAQLRAQVGDDTTPAAGDTDSPQAQLQALEQLRRSGDPSVTVEARAEVPTSAASPRPLLTVAAAVIGGLVLGLVGAFALQLVDPRLRREDQLRARFRLPILARIPLEKRRRKRPLLPGELSLAALDGYQALRAALTSSRSGPEHNRAVLVTGPTPGDGKTTASINLASTIAAAGHSVILVEGDSRRPAVGKALSMRTSVGLASVVTGRADLEEALLPVGEPDSNLRVLLTSQDEAPAADVMSHASADTLLRQAEALADWVIVDSPPLNHVAETMAIARAVDDVLVVVRVGKTNTRDLSELAEMLEQQDIAPAGFVVLGGQARTAYY